MVWGNGVGMVGGVTRQGFLVQKCVFSKVSSASLV